MSATEPSDADLAVSAVSPELQRAGAIGRFAEPIETTYQHWAIRQVVPMVRVLAWFTIPIYLLNPFFVNAIFHWGFPAPILIACYVVDLPLSVVWLLVLARRPSFWFYVVVLVVQAFSTVPAVLLSDIERPGTTIVALLFIFLFTIPVLQLSFRLAIVAVVLVTGPNLVAALACARSSESDGSLAFLIYVAIAASILCIMFRFAGERNSRDRFVTEQELARQRELLAESRALIRRYAPPAVADRIEIGDTTVDTAQRRRVTVLFADVVGFTALADRLDPEALAEIVNDYLGSIAQIIETHRGTLNEFAGDGVMAIFGAPEEMEPEEQVVAALAAAQDLQRSLPGWSQRWYRLGIDHDLQARIGINTGVISVGTFGSAVRATYTGIGLHTNIAARIQAQCDPGSVLLSKTSWHLLNDAIACEPRGEVEVKGVHFPIAMYEPANR